jgi:voltage-gated potassium channel
MQGWFFVDFLASTPWTWIFSSKTFKVFKLLKLVRLIKLPVFMEMLDNHFQISKAGIQITCLIVGIICMAHWSACVFFFVSVSDLEEGELPSWMPLGEVGPYEWKLQYLNSFYWSVSTLTTVGYGDITPASNAERFAASIIMLFGGSFYGYVIALMAQLVSKFNINKQRYETKLDEVKSYMVSRNLPRDLQQRIKQYYKHYMHAKTAMNEKTIMTELSTVLRYEVAAHLVEEIIYKVPIFQGRDPHVIAQLVVILKPCTCAPGDTIIEVGEAGRDMYIIVKGNETHQLSSITHTMCIPSKLAYVPTIKRFSPTSLTRIKVLWLPMERRGNS